MAKSNKGTFIDRLKVRFEDLQKKWPALSHLTRTAKRYQDRKGDFFAAGVTYFSVLSIFPLLMVGFAILGQVLVDHPELLGHIKDRITSGVQGGLAKQVSQLIDSAVASRKAVGIAGLAVGLWSGLGWIAALRESLTQLWEQEPPEQNIIKTKLSDLLALASFGVAVVVVFGLIAISKSEALVGSLGKLGLGDLRGSQDLIKIISTVLATVAAWVLFTFVISRLPRQPVRFGDAMEAGLLGAVVFEIFQELAWLVLKGVTSGPAGKTFGPLLGLMVFLFFTIRILLFAAAWAATETGALARASQAREARQGGGARGAAAGAASGWMVGAFGVADLGAQEDGGQGEDDKKPAPARREKVGARRRKR